MSRGPGRVQRALTGGILGDQYQTILDLAAAVNDTSEPTRGQTETVRRACRKLHTSGRAELDYLWRPAARCDLPTTGYELWSDLGDGRSSIDPAHRPTHAGWQLAARKSAESTDL